MVFESAKAQAFDYCKDVIIPHIDGTLQKIRDIGGVDIILFPEVESRLLFFITKELLSKKYTDMHVKVLRIMASERMLGLYSENKSTWETVNSDRFYKEFSKRCRAREPYDLIRDMRGKKVAVIDDMIETGKTVYSVARYVEERGAKLCLVSAIEIKETTAEDMKHRFTIPVLWASKYGQSMVQMIRDGKRAVLGMNIFTMNISLFYDPEKQLAVSQRRFAPQMYNDFQSSGQFNMVSVFRLKVELEKLVDDGAATKLKGARWSDEPYNSLLEKLFKKDANIFLYHLNRKEWFEDAHKDINLIIASTGKTWQMSSKDMPELRRSGAKDKVRELEDEIREIENMYRAIEHPYEYTPYNLYNLELYASSKKGMPRIYELKKMISGYIECLESRRKKYAESQK